MGETGDESAIQIVSRLGVDYSQAVTDVRDLAGEFTKLNKGLQAVEKQFGRTAQQMVSELGPGMNSIVNQMTRNLQSHVKSSSDALDQLGKVTEAKLARIEARLAAVAAKGKQLGVSVPDLDQHMTTVRNLRDTVAGGFNVDQQQHLVIEAASQFATVQAQTLATIERETVTLANGARGYRLMEDSANRRLLAEQLANDQLARQAQAAGVALPQLEAQVAAVQARLRAEHLSHGELGEQATLLRMQVEQLQQRLALEGRLTQAEVAQTLELQRQAKVLEANARTALSDQGPKPKHSHERSMEDMFQGQIKNALIGVAVYGGARALSAGMEDVGDVEMRMTQLSRVIEDPLFKLGEMRQQLFKLGEEFGFTFQPVEDIAERWAQAGYDMKDSLELTRGSLLALNTAELNNEEATNDLIGIMKQWGLAAGELVPLIDKVNKVADDYAVTSQDLVDGLLRSSGAAKNANMTLEQTIGLITVMREASGRSGKEVGNALNSIVSYMSKSKFLETLESSGVPAFANAAQQKLRPVFDVIKDLSENWDKLGENVKQRLIEEGDAAGLFSEEMAGAAGALDQWTDLQKRDIMQTGAGVYRRNYLLALLKNFSQVYDVLKTQETALGYSQRENARTMETYQKKVESLKAAWQEIMYSIATDGGLLDTLKGPAGGLKAIADWFNHLPPGARKVAIAVAEISTALGALNWLAKQTGAKGLADGFTKLKNAIKATKASIDEAGGIRPALAGLAADAAALLVIVSALAALTAAFVKASNEANRLQSAFSHSKETSEAAIQAAEAEAKIHSQNALQIMKLADQYRTLDKQKQQLTDADQARLADIAAQHEAISQQVAQAIGKEAEARLSAAGYSQDASQTVVDAEKTKAKEARDAADKQIKAYRDTIIAQMQQAEKSIETIEKGLDGWHSYLTFFERVGYGFRAIINEMKLAVYDLSRWVNVKLGEMYGGLADFIAKIPGINKVPGMKGLVGELKGASESAYATARELWNARVDVEEQWQKDLDAATAPAITRQRKLLADLRQELDRLMETGTGAGATGGDGQFGTGDTKESDRVKSLTDQITANVDAIGKENEANQRRIDLLQSRIAYYTREGASLEELTQADKDRAELTRVLTERQTILHNQAEAARQAYASLAEAQKHVNRSTEDGQKAYDELDRTMESLQKTAGQAASEWWKLEGDKAQILRENNAVSAETIRQLGELKDKYDEGLISVQQYAAALAGLETQSGLTKNALAELNKEQARALKEQWSTDVENAWDKALKGIDNDIDTVRNNLKTTTDVLDSAIEGIDATAADIGREKPRSVLEKALAQLRGQKPSVAGLPKVADITGLAQNALASFQLKDLGKLTPEEFAKAINADVSILKGAAGTAQGYLNQVNDYASRRLEEIEEQLKGIDAGLQTKVDELQKQIDALDTEKQQGEREKATKEHNDRIKALQSDLTWYLLKDQEKYKFEIASLQRQMGDENQKWQEQLNDWAREDKKQSLQDQIKAEQKAAEERKKTLTDERDALQETQKNMQTVLSAMIEYINDEIKARRSRVEEEKKGYESVAQKRVEDLQDTKKKLEEKKLLLDKHFVDMLAGLAAKDPLFLQQGQSLIDNLIAGINSKGPELDTAISNINSKIQSLQSAQAAAAKPSVVDAVNRAAAPAEKAMNLAKSGNLEEAAKLLAGSYPGMTVEGAKQSLENWLKTVPKMSVGAYVAARPGGILANIAEGGDDEVVLGVRKIRPLLTTAMADVLRGFQLGSAPATGDISGAIRDGLKGVQLGPFFGVVQVRMPDGHVEEQVIEMFSGFRQAVRSGFYPRPGV